MEEDASGDLILEAMSLQQTPNPRDITQKAIEPPKLRCEMQRQRAIPRRWWVKRKVEEGGDGLGRVEGVLLVRGGVETQELPEDRVDHSIAPA